MKLFKWLEWAHDKPAEHPGLLLFFTIKGEDIYFIDVKDHPKGSGWFDRE